MTRCAAVVGLIALLGSAALSGCGGDPKEPEDGYDRYWFRTSPAALDLLADAGVDVVTMANNHGADYGLTGLRDTLEAVRHSGAVVHDQWTPARIGLWGLPRPLRGAARRAAVSDWRRLRASAGLRASPTTLLPRLQERDPEKTVEEGP